MDVKDLRIGDIVGVKTINNGRSFCFVELLDKNEDVVLMNEEEECFHCSASFINGIKVEHHTLSNLGAWYDDKKVEHIFTFKGGLRIAVRPQVGTENYIATRIGEYRPKCCRFTYLHELQHWLWDIYNTTIY